MTRNSGIFSVALLIAVTRPCYQDNNNKHNLLNLIKICLGFLSCRLNDHSKMIKSVLVSGFHFSRNVSLHDGMSCHNVTYCHMPQTMIEHSCKMLCIQTLTVLHTGYCGRLELLSQELSILFNNHIS